MSVHPYLVLDLLLSVKIHLARLIRQRLLLVDTLCKYHRVNRQIYEVSARLHCSNPEPTWEEVETGWGQIQVHNENLMVATFAVWCRLSFDTSACVESYRGTTSCEFCRSTAAQHSVVETIVNCAVEIVQHPKLFLPCA